MFFEENFILVFYTNLRMQKLDIVTFITLSEDDFYQYSYFIDENYHCIYLFFL